MKLGDFQKYKIHSYHTGFFSGTVNARKLEAVLNQHDQDGWVLNRTIHETSRVLLLFRRETHFLIFQRRAS